MLALLAGLLPFSAGEAEAASDAGPSIERFSENVTVRTSVGGHDFSFYVEPTGDDGVDKVYYQGNVPPVIGFDVTFGSLTLSADVPLPTMQTELRGKTEYTDFQTSYYGRWFGADAYYQNYSGFYIHDTKAIDPNWQEGDAFAQRPDLHSHGFGLNFYYLFNGNSFSYKAAFEQTERQRTFAATPIVMLSTDSLTLSAGQPIVPQSYSLAFGADRDLTRLQVYSAALSGGGAVTIPLGKVFATGSATIGPGRALQKIELADGTTSERISTTLKRVLRLAIGYNGDEMFGGFSLTLQGADQDLQDMSLGMNVFSTELLFVGARF